MNKLFSSSVATATVNPFTALEALQEITDICNSIQLSTPAFEALMELPSLAREFDNASTAKLSMLNFVAEQHYDTLGLTNVSVSQEGIFKDAWDGFVKFLTWLKDKAIEFGKRLMAWFKGDKTKELEKKHKETLTSLKAREEAVGAKPADIPKDKDSGDLGTVTKSQGKYSGDNVESLNKLKLLCVNIGYLIKNFETFSKEMSVLPELTDRLNELSNKHTNWITHNSPEKENSEVNKKLRASMKGLSFSATRISKLGYTLVHMSKTIEKILKFIKAPTEDKTLAISMTKKLETILEGVSKLVEALPKARIKERVSIISETIKEIDRGVNSGEVYTDDGSMELIKKLESLRVRYSDGGNEGMTTVLKIVEDLSNILGDINYT